MFEYRNPEAILEVVLTDPGKRNMHGHTVEDDFKHFCAVTGCDESNAWAKLALAWVWKPGDSR
jgi:hypothetical protein